MKSVAEIFRSYAVLDADGRHVNGTDKESNHRYGDAYERLFRTNDHWSYGLQAPRRNVKLMMEVGVADGSSLLAWREVFPNATCVGLDIMPDAVVKLHDKDRVEFFVGDQWKREDCDRAAAGRMFDIIVEDATHELDATLLTLYWLWPYVRPGGMYVVEEWSNVDRGRICSLWSQAEVVDTVGPFGGTEPLVVFRKPTP